MEKSNNFNESVSDVSMEKLNKKKLNLVYAMVYQ